MPQLRKATKKWKFIDRSVSYDVLKKDKLIDASNVYPKNGRLNTRPPLKIWRRMDDSSTPIDSISWHKDSSGLYNAIVKQGTNLIACSETSQSTLKSGLTDGIKHRGVTYSGRHFIAMGVDGLFSTDGTIFTQLGQSAPAFDQSTDVSAVYGVGGTFSTTVGYSVRITYYSSSTGFESNALKNVSILSSTPANFALRVTLPTTADNLTIDKVRIYLAEDSIADDQYFFISEVDLGTSSYDILSSPTSTQVPPTKNGFIPSNKGKYLAIFDGSLVIAGNDDYPNDIFISERYYPDAFDQTSTARTLFADGQGDVTGIGVGFYNNDGLNPFLCIFKRDSIQIYSEIGGLPYQATISDDIGCISHDTIKTIDGVVYFMSAQGWYSVINGRLAYRAEGKPAEISGNDLDSIFNKNTGDHNLTRSNFDNFFSCYYPTLNQYMTFVSEDGGTDISRCYTFDVENRGFYPFNFSALLSGVANWTSSNEIDYLLFSSATSGRIYSYATNEETDATRTNIESGLIEPFIVTEYTYGDDIDATFNFGYMYIRAKYDSDALNARVYLDYNRQDFESSIFPSTEPDMGFVLDESKLDEGVMINSDKIEVSKVGIFKTAKSLMVQLYKDNDGDIGLIDFQVDVSKNGALSI